MSQPVYKMPSIDEILAGDTQGGVPRPTASTDAIFTACPAQALRPRTVWQWIRAIFVEAGR